MHVLGSQPQLDAQRAPAARHAHLLVGLPAPLQLHLCPSAVPYRAAAATFTRGASSQGSSAPKASVAAAAAAPRTATSSWAATACSSTPALQRIV